MAHEADPVELETPDPPKQTYKEAYAPIGSWPTTEQLPIIYHRYYNVSFFGLEKWNRFDAWKLDKIYALLVERGVMKENELPSPAREASQELLLAVHDEAYLEQIQTTKLAMIRVTELPSLFLLPNALVQRQLVAPLKYQVAGTVLALGIALERGWAIQLGGGMIHASPNRGAGWCPFDDISCAVHYARAHTSVQTVMVIDLGAHQGNGYQNQKLATQDEDLIILDVYNEVIFPQDQEARRAIDIERRLSCGATSEMYLTAVESALKEAQSYTPDVILYAAGTNVLEEDYSGQFRVQREDVYLRDQWVFEFAKEKGIPICMVLSSGYSKTSFEVVAESISRLVKGCHLS